MDPEDAVRLIVEQLARLLEAGSQRQTIEIRPLAETWSTRDGRPLNQTDDDPNGVIASLWDAAWHLALRGYLRPGIQSLPQGGRSARDAEFSLTAVGRHWIQSGAAAAHIPAEPSRLAELLARHRSRFGEGYHQRAIEAVRCYTGQAALACCVMCGAATESIILRIAIERTGDEQRVLTLYAARQGTANVQRLLTDGLAPRLRHEVIAVASLLGYWRNEAAHGQHTDLSNTEAAVALTSLLQFSQVADDNWDELTTAPMS